MSGALARWWRSLFPPADVAPGGPSAAGRPGTGGAGGLEPGRAPAPRRYTPPPRDDDPQREAHLGAVLQVLAGGPLTRDALAARVGAAEWGPGRFDAVVDHGVTSGVLRADGDRVRARYAD